jgi:hypothetical protein
MMVAASMRNMPRLYTPPPKPRPSGVGRLALPAALRLAQRFRGDPRRRERRAVPDRAAAAGELRHKQYYWPETNVLITRFLPLFVHVERARFSAGGRAHEDREENRKQAVLAEYRSRKVWSPAAPDAAQVDRITCARSDGSFTLEKVDGTWRVAGKPDVMIKPEAVTDLLDALAGLRAERYIADKATDLKPYGLDPQSPDLIKLEVQTPTGKHTLHIGREEGGSKRRYATVPGEGAPVFLTSEADAKRLVRTLGRTVPATKASSARVSCSEGKPR